MRAKREIGVVRMSQAPVVPVLSVPSRPLVSATEDVVGIPWTIWFITAAATLNLISVMWDDTWHNSIGVDTSWVPPHILTQISAVVALIACTSRILATTMNGASPERDASVRIMGLYGPTGAFIAAWGSLATLVGEQFDSWWHQAYGDVTVVTPPHLLILLGSVVGKLGGMAWIASIMNRSTNEVRGRLTWLFLVVGTTGMTDLLGFVPGIRSMHTADYYRMFALAVPIWLVACACGSRQKWGATIVAAFGLVLPLAALWLLPLIPAQPKFGPVYHNITHMVPPRFPMLLIVPALVVDVLLRRLEQRSSWIKAVWIGPGLMLGCLAAQWPFATFLLSSASRNRIFGSAYFSYRDPAGYLYDPYQFRIAEKPGTFLLTLAIAFVASVVTTRLGLGWGEWLKRVRK